MEKGCDLPKVMSQWRARNSTRSPESAQQLLTCRHLAGKGSRGAAGSIPIPGESWHGNSARVSLPPCLPELIPRWNFYFQPFLWVPLQEGDEAGGAALKERDWDGLQGAVTLGLFLPGSNPPSQGKTM